MRIEARVDTRTVKRVQTKLNYIRRHGGKDLTPVNRRAGIWLLRWINENFRDQGSKTGKRWKPFAAGGRWKKGKFDPNAKLLQDTGALRSSFDYKANKRSAVVGSDLEYSKYHEEGVPRRNLPERRMLPRHTDTEVLKYLADIYEDYILKVLVKAKNL